MKLRTWLVLALCCASLSALILGIPTAPASEKVKPSGLRVGIVKTMFRDTPAPLVQFAMRPFKAMLEADTGLRGEIVTSGDIDQVGSELKDEKLQLGVFQGVEFAWAKLKHPELTPLILCVNKEPFIKATIVVRMDSKLEAIGDLYGKDLALPCMSREHSQLFLQRRCARPGETAEKTFAKITTPSGAEDALDDVVDGVVQGALLDHTALAAYRENKPGRAGKLKVLVQSEPFPSGVVAYYPGSLDDAMLGRIKSSLLNAGKTQQGKNFLEMCRITGFEAVPENYDQLFKDIAKAYPPTPAK